MSEGWFLRSGIRPHLFLGFGTVPFGVQVATWRFLTTRWGMHRGEHGKSADLASRIVLERDAAIVSCHAKSRSLAGIFPLARSRNPAWRLAIGARVSGFLPVSPVRYLLESAIEFQKSPVSGAFAGILAMRAVRSGLRPAHCSVPMLEVRQGRSLTGPGNWHPGQPSRTT